jgi:predicted ATPase
MAEQGRNEEGIALIQEGLAASRATGAELWRPSFLCLLAEACRETGRLDDGLSALTEALAAADEHKNRPYEAEMHRVKGELLSPGLLSARDRGCAKAKRQIVELRATVSLARLLAKQGRREEARTNSRAFTTGSPKASTPPT